MVPLIQGLSEIAARYDHFIIDIFGVIHDGIRPYPHSIRALQGLKAAGKTICLLSNSPKRAVDAEAQMRSIGIPDRCYDFTVTSGEASYHALQNLPPDWGHACWYINAGFYTDLLDGLDFTPAKGAQDASFILITSLPEHDARAMAAIHAELDIAAARNIPMLCTNPDLIVHIGGTEVICPGTLAAQYEALGGEVLYIGKPHAPVYEQCFELLGMPDRSRICAIGDSFHTDIRGAHGAGIDSVMNLVGIHWPDVADGANRLAPDKLKTLLSGNDTRPTYVMAGMDW